MLTLQECYKILGVGPDASAQEVRKAYLILVKRWHPDAHADDQKEKAKDRFFQIQTAYEQLKAHDDTASDPTPIEKPVESPKTAQKVSTELRADSLYQNATALGEKGLYREAIAELSFAIRVDPHYIRAYQYRGHLNSLLGLERQAEADLNKAKVLQRLGDAAVYKSQADIENLAREYLQPKARSRFQRKRQNRSTHKRQKSSTPMWLIWSAIAASVVLVGWLLLRSSSDQSSPFYPRPLNLESPAIES